MPPGIVGYSKTPLGTILTEREDVDASIDAVRTFVGGRKRG